MLARRAPEPGKGWGCVVCGLPPDGASYVACDDCLKARKKPIEVVVGYLYEGRRIRIENLGDEPFEHDMAKHADD